MIKKKPRSSPAKVQALLKNLKFIISQHLQGRNFRPSTTDELILRLAILPEQSHVFAEALEEMKAEGILSQSANGAWMPVGLNAREYFEGVISFHPRGFAFVRIDGPTSGGPTSGGPTGGSDVFIPPSNTLNALPSDRVSIEIVERDAKGPVGRVVHILQRGKNSLHGVVLENSSSSRPRVAVLIPALSQHRPILQLEPEQSVRIGDRVLVKVLDWEKQAHEISCSLVEVMGHIDNASDDIDIALSEFGLKREFPSEVLDEALALGSRVSPKEIAARRDLRETLSVTIDPDTAKDYDDAISIERIGEEYHLSVHIADVAHYVKHNSQLDLEARRRGNSTYFPGYCLPMLPSELSNELCSLKPNVNRLCVSVMMRLDGEGTLIDYEICRTVIRSRKRLTYRGAMAILENEPNHALRPTLDLMVELCGKFKAKKAQRGSIEFSLPEAVILCDQQGEPVGTDFVTYDITHQMIEEFMVKANELVATHLSKIGRSAIYRVHEAPLLEDLREFFQIARFFGHQFSGMPTPQEWHHFFLSIKDAPYINQLATAYIRSMRLAQYSTKNVGHYGLGLEYYCHFTSPIRRYSDLTVIRALFDEPRDQSIELEMAAQRCCDTERQSAKAEQSVVGLKKLRYLKKCYEAKPDAVWNGLVVKVKPFGVTFDVQNMILEGFLHISQLSDDFFIYDEPRLLLRGRHTGLVLRAGTVIQLEIERVDLIYRECQWHLHPALLEMARRERAAKKAASPDEFDLPLDPTYDRSIGSPSTPHTPRKEGSRHGQRRRSEGSSSRSSSAKKRSRRR